MLTKTSCNPKHFECILVVSFQLSWKEGFESDQYSYTKSEIYKKTLEKTIKDNVNKVFEYRFRQFTQQLSQGGEVDFLSVDGNALVITHDNQQILFLLGAEAGGNTSSLPLRQHKCKGILWMIS